MLSPINQENIPTIKDLKNRHSQRLMKKHNLTGIGVGIKKVNGKSTGKPCLVFLVKKKLSKKQISTDQLLPSSLEGVDCDVIETGEIKALALSYTTKIRPAQPGYSVGHYLVTAGTLGCVVYKGSTKYVLSNNHVLANENDCSVGDPIYQPGTYDGGTSADTIAYLDSWIPITEGVNVDCAIGKVTDDTLVTNIGAWGNSINSYHDPILGDTLYKSGRTTGDTFGTVTNVNTDVAVSYGALGTVTISDCFITDNSMSAGGDSGSCMRFDDTTAAGLLFAGGGTTTISIYMTNIVTALGISFTPPSSRYWVGGTDNWDATAGTKWSTTSGGAGGATVPGASDVVIIESGSVTVTTSVDIGGITHTGGTLNTNNQSITIVNNFTTTGTTSRTLTLGSSTISCAGFIYSGSGLTLNENTSTIQVSGTGNFNGNGETYYIVQLTGTSQNVTGTNTFTNFSRTNSSEKGDALYFANNQTISSTFTVTSNSATNLISVMSTQSGTQRTITAATFSINYAAFRDIVLAGAGSPVTPTSAQNLGNNSGINFPSPVRYWVGGTGNWSDGSTHWSLTSGGSPGQTMPGISDDVYFDSLSNS